MRPSVIVVKYETMAIKKFNTCSEEERHIYKNCSLERVLYFYISDTKCM